jgi:hypothetical protein
MERKGSVRQIGSSTRFRYLRFKTFPMTPRTPQCEVFCPLLLSSEHSGVPEDSKFPTFSKCWASPPHLAKVGLRHVMLAGGITAQTTRMPLRTHASLFEHGEQSQVSKPEPIPAFASENFICCRCGFPVQRKILGTESSFVNHAACYKF